MKLLIADTQFPKGHSLLNNRLLMLISQIDEIEEIKVINYKGYYVNDYRKVKYYSIPFLLFCKNFPILNYIFQFVNALIILLKCWNLKYDKILFFTFDTLSFSLFRWGTFTPIFLFHHNNTDHLQNKNKRKLFGLYGNRVFHIVFADFIREYLVGIGVKEELIFALPHPLLFSGMVFKPVLGIDCEKMYVALGHANDEKLIREIVEYEYRTHELEKRNIKLVIRSRQNFVYKPQSIEIVHGFLSEEQYQTYYYSASGILILYSTYFQNRFSGALLDAMCARKIIIGRNIPIVRYFAEEYPKCCFLFENVADLFIKLSSVSTGFDNCIYEKFINQHSDERIKSCLNEILL